MNLFPQTGQDCILFSPNTHIPLLFLSFFLMQCYFLFQTESELEWFQEGSRPALQTASIVREMWRLEDERDAEKLSFRLC